MGCQYLEEAFELFLLGTLPAEESAEIRAHLDRHCPLCIARLREAGMIVYLLAGGARPGRPGPKWKQNMLRHLKKKK